MIIVKKNNYREMNSVAHDGQVYLELSTYAAGNVKGPLNRRVDWFRTPTFNRNAPKHMVGLPLGIRRINFS